MTQGIGLGRSDGAFSHYVRVAAPERDKTVFVLPETVSDEAGALVEPFSVGLHAVNSARVSPTDRAVVFGAGMIGLCVVAALRAKGVTDILVVDYSERRLQLASQLGARAIHNPREGSARAFVGRHFGEEMTRFADEPLCEASVVFDCAGVPAVLTDGLRSLGRRGRFVIVADHHGAAMFDVRLLMLRRITMIGVLAYDEEFAEAIDLMARGVVDLIPLITHRFALEDMAEAFRAQLDGAAAVKVMMTNAIG
jgi:threonine dehydrogenase-like Zn-dependent dehydrogenase